MTNKELVRKQDLCATLNMNFDEADELFSSETLSNMKMAQMGWGIVITVTLVWGGITAVSALITVGVVIHQTYFNDDAGTTGPGAVLRIDSDGVGWYGSQRLGYLEIRVDSAGVTHGSFSTATPPPV